MINFFLNSFAIQSIILSEKKKILKENPKFEKKKIESQT